jgi:hypothetical protein
MSVFTTQRYQTTNCLGLAGSIETLLSELFRVDVALLHA